MLRQNHALDPGKALECRVHNCRDFLLRLDVLYLPGSEQPIQIVVDRAHSILESRKRRIIWVIFVLLENRLERVQAAHGNLLGRGYRRRFGRIEYGGCTGGQRDDALNQGNDGSRQELNRRTRIESASDAEQRSSHNPKPKERPEEPGRAGML